MVYPVVEQSCVGHNVDEPFSQNQPLDQVLQSLRIILKDVFLISHAVHCSRGGGHWGSIDGHFGHICGHLGSNVKPEQDGDEKHRDDAEGHHPDGDARHETGQDAVGLVYL